MSANFESIFYHKAQEIYNVLDRRGVPDADGYDTKVHLRCSVSSDGKTVVFSRADNGYSRMVFANITPKDLLHLNFSSPQVLKSEQIDANAEQVDNIKGSAPIKETYEGTFAASETAEQSISAGASLSIGATFKEGGDASPVSAEQTMTAEVHSEWSKTTDKESEVSRTVSYEEEVQPGDAIEIFATRSVDKVKRIITGTGDFSYTIQVGKWRHGNWERPRHTVGTVGWDSLDDLILTCQGNAPDNYNLSGSFKKRPPEAEAMHWLVAPLIAPFRQEIIYDDVTNTHVVEKSLVSGKVNVKRLVADGG